MKTRKKTEKSGQQGTAPRTKIYVVEDHPVFREGMARLIAGEEDFILCGSAGDAVTAREEIVRLKPDLALVDISLPGKSGLELIRELREANEKLKLLVVSMHDEALYANRVLRLGADGYIMKKEEPSELVQAVRDVLAGHIYVSETVLASGEAGPGTQDSVTTRSLNQLTDTELEILELLGLGKTNEEIAEQLHSSEDQIKTGCEGIRKKLKLKSDNALIRFAVCWIETP
jgi:DNA-binding NarL/FixJ family response regulator